MITKNIIKKVFLVAFLMIISLSLFPTNVHAYSLKNRKELIQAANIGETVRIRNGHYGGGDDRNVISQSTTLADSKNCDHVYCIEHNHSTGPDVVTKEFTVKAYARIEGNNAYRTKTGGTPIQDEKNLALAYILSQEADKYSLGYNPTEPGQLTRTRSLHKYLCKGRMV